MRRLLTLFAVTLVMGSVLWVHTLLGDVTSQLAFSGIVLGFVLIAGFLLGEVVAAVKLPRITGYLLAGLFFGPHAIGFVSFSDQSNLEFVELMAISLIALTAGGELEFRRIRPRLRAILLITVLQVVALFGGTVGFVLAAHDVFPYANEQGFQMILAMGLLLGVVAIASSPSVTIAVIVETGSRGPATDTILGVTVLKDIALLVLFAIVLSFSRRLAGISSGGTIINFAWEMGGSFIGGGLLALVLYLYIRFVKAETPLFILGAAFLGMKVSEVVNIHPLLVCMTAGLLIANITRQGEEMIKAIERGSLPVYVLFFCLAGSHLDIKLLVTMALPACMFSLFRVVMMYASTLGGAVLAGEKAERRRFVPLGFLSMAGISISIATVVGKQFPGFGEGFLNLVLAVIVIKQLVGPAVLKWVLTRTGETNR